MRFPGVVAAAFSACVGCSLFSSLSGLSGEGPAEIPDGGGLDGRATSDAETSPGDGGGGDGAAPSEAKRAYLFATGGAERPYSGPDVTSAKTFYAEILEDGLLGPWKAGPDLPSPRQAHTAIGIGSELFVIGGRKSNTDTSSATSVVSLRILPDGTATMFEEREALPIGVADTRAVTAEGNVYAIHASLTRAAIASATSAGLGAWRAQYDMIDSGAPYYGTASAIGNDILWFGPGVRAIRWPVNSDGSLGAWRSANPPPVTIQNAYAITACIGRHLYMIGEWYIGLGKNTVAFSEMGTDHTLGPWIPTEPFPVARESHSALAYGSYVYVLGGAAVGTGTFSPITDVYVSKAADDGKLGLWRKTSALPEWHAYSFALVAPP